MALRQFGAAAAVTLALALATPAYAVTEIQWWHAMTGGNNDIVNKLAEEFNASQSDYKVIPTFKGSYPDTMNAGIAAFRAGTAPHIIQVFAFGEHQRQPYFAMELAEGGSLRGRLGDG